jgi:cyclophilin family peptidyl-prolyl cis-trans isomerase
MLSLIFAVAIHQTPTYVKPYNPTGPKIEVAMASGGKFTITTDPAHSPETVAHVLDLVRSKFYDKQRVHRVEYWVTQWGDPLSRTKPMTDPKMGDGDSGHRLTFEMSDIDFTRGVVGIASDGLQNGGDSQLFVIKSDRMYLYHSYAVLGKVTSGMEVVDRIKKGDRILRMSVASRKSPTLLFVPILVTGVDLGPTFENYNKAGWSWNHASSHRKNQVAFAKAANVYGDAIIAADLPPRDKYPTALRVYRQIVGVDAGNKPAQKMIKMIEDTYRAMGRPIPK